MTFSAALNVRMNSVPLILRMAAREECMGYFYIWKLIKTYSANRNLLRF